jgi:hypothetical protein
MAPLNTHLLIAERLWPVVPGPWQPYFGQFCFGCVVPDIDKLSPVLTQKSTHFFDPTDEEGLMFTHRSVTFIQQQAEFLRAPFAGLTPPEQAFALGYLCHLAVDEVSRALWDPAAYQRFREIGVSSLVAVSTLDEIIWPYFRDYQGICRALYTVTPLAVIPGISMADLGRMQDYLFHFTQAETAEKAMALVLKMMYSTSQADFEQRLAAYHHERSLITTQIGYLQFDRVISAGLDHSHHRLAALIAGQVPQPGLPDLEA